MDGNGYISPRRSILCLVVAIFLTWVFFFVQFEVPEVMAHSDPNSAVDRRLREREVKALESIAGSLVQISKCGFYCKN